MITKKSSIAYLFVLVFLVIAGCSLVMKDIAEVKSDQYLDEEVTIRGTVENSISIGGLSGFTIVQKDESIFVLSDAIPAKGEVVTVKGVLKENIIIGYYIDTTKN